MRETNITLPELGLIAGTRAAAGAGLGLLLADRLGDRERKAVGWTLLVFGALTTIPLAMEVLGGLRSRNAKRLSHDGRKPQSRPDDRYRREGAAAS
ncbi:MAG TPA: hypothetical protein VMV10_09330 [Pirellulales bacterium]|nr:hypothetical protein [Pirellulales bacterium]